MVLPTDHHWALRGWMRTHGVESGEAAGILIVQNLEGLLQLCGAPRRLSPDEHRLVAEARSRGGETTQTRFSGEPDAPSMALRRRVDRLLTEVCKALRQVGVKASPYHGLGVMTGDEVLEAQVCLDETARLYALMKAAGFVAEPDWDAPPFRERAWAEP